MARRGGTSHLSDWAKPVEREKKWREKKEGEKREEEKMREKLIILSSFSRRSGCQRSLEKEAKFVLTSRVSSRDRNWGVRQTPRGRGFSYSVLFLL